MMALAMFVQVMSSVFSAGFMARQAGDPILLSMGRAEQRALVSR